MACILTVFNRTSGLGKLSWHIPFVSLRRFVSFLNSQYESIVIPFEMRIVYFLLAYNHLRFLSVTAAVTHFCVYVMQLPTNMKGGNGKVAYIDTEGTLYPLIS